MKLVEHRWVSVLWCDDIRNEVGNKPSFMGVYTGELVVPALPTVLPKLCAFVRIATPKNQPFKQLKIRVEKNDVSLPVGLIELTDEDLIKASEDLAMQDASRKSKGDDEPKALTMMFMLVLGGIQITESSKWMRVYVDNEGETLESFKLRFEVNPGLIT